MQQHRLCFNLRLPRIMVIASTLCLLIMTESCTKSETTPVTPTPITVAPTVVGTWSLVDATLSTGTKTQTVSRDNAIKTPYIPADDVVFTTDGKYTQGKISGTWKVSGSKLTIDTRIVELFTLSTTELKFGNNYPDVSGATATDRDLNGGEAIFYAQKLLDTINGGAFSISTDKTAKYQLNYRKK
jgi:hypothetical protein